VNEAEAGGRTLPPDSVSETCFLFLSEPLATYDVGSRLSIPPSLHRCPKITSISTQENGDSTVVIRNSSGTETSQVVPAGLTLIVKEGDVVKADQGLNVDPNAGGFGQEESEIVLQNPIRILGYLAFCFSVLLTQVLIVLKKKQFEKVQAAELNF